LVTEEQREAVIEIVSQSTSEESPPKVVGLDGSMFFLEHTDWRARDAAVIAAIQLMREMSPKSGCWNIVKCLKLKGYLFNNKCLPRLLSSWIEFAAPKEHCPSGPLCRCRLSQQ